MLGCTRPIHMLPPKRVEWPLPGHQLQEATGLQLRLDSMAVIGINEMSRPATRRHGGCSPHLTFNKHLAPAFGRQGSEAHLGGLPMLYFFLGLAEGQTGELGCIRNRARQDIHGVVVP